MMPIPKNCDVLIAGGSFTGLMLAIAVANTFRSELKILVTGFDEDAMLDRQNPRAFALSAASKNMLEALGLWASIEASAQPVRSIELTDSPLTAGIRPKVLCYSNVLDDGSPASFIVPAYILGQALINNCKSQEASGTLVLATTRVAKVSSDEGQLISFLESDAIVRSRLVVAAEGRTGNLRTAAGLDTVRFDHRQLGIVTIVKHEKPHHETAIQHFLPAGPFAVLPLKGQQSCITWSEDKAVAEHIMQLDDREFLQELDQRFAGRFGAIELVGPRRSFPLATEVARRFVAERFALVGDSAHAVHPIAGQGLNLAFRDIAALTECMANGSSVGLDIADPMTLETYESWRRFDSVLAAGVFAGINMLFANDRSLLRSVREMGLGAVQQLDGLKGIFVRHAAGQAGELPKFLRGERIII